MCMRARNWMIAVMCAGGMGVSANALAATGIPGDAAGYNVFIFGNGNFVSQNTDTMGNLAAGGNVSLMNYGVAQGIAGNPSVNPNPARLVVGGTLTAQNGGVGSNQAGAIYTNNTPTLTGFTATGGIHAQSVVSSFAKAMTAPRASPSLSRAIPMRKCASA